jgi:hypothetical protein
MFVVYSRNRFYVCCVPGTLGTGLMFFVYSRNQFSAFPPGGPAQFVNIITLNMEHNMCDRYFLFIFYMYDFCLIPVTVGIPFYLIFCESESLPFFVWLFWYLFGGSFFYNWCRMNLLKKWNNYRYFYNVQILRVKTKYGIVNLKINVQ